MNKFVHSLFTDLQKRNGKQDYVFLNSRNGRVKSLRKAFDTARVKAGLPELRFHDLRHTAATRMALTGRLDVVRKVLGHSVINVTMRYVHPNEEDERAVVETLASKCPDSVPTNFRDSSVDEVKVTQVPENAQKSITKPT